MVPSSWRLRKARKIEVQRRTLALPLVFLFLLQWFTVTLTLFCDLQNGAERRWASELCGSSTYTSSLMDPTGRLNRMLRFTLFVAFLQALPPIPLRPTLQPQRGGPDLMRMCHPPAVDAAIFSPLPDVARCALQIFQRRPGSPAPLRHVDWPCAALHRQAALDPRWRHSGVC